jgi:hypothetical protein
MIYFNGHPVSGIGEDRADHLRAALMEVLKSVKAFGQALTPRERLILEIGLKASHMEESLASGDWKRAEAHMHGLVDLFEQFSQQPGTTMRGGELGFWPWDSSKWRYYFGMEADRVATRAGPLWLTDHDAAVREADIVQEGLAQGRALSSVRYDWDESAGRWRLA